MKNKKTKNCVIILNLKGNFRRIKNYISLCLHLLADAIDNEMFSSILQTRKFKQALETNWQLDELV